MGISIKLYRIGTAENISEFEDLEKEIERSAATHVDLYKMGQDLAMIFLNKANPYNDTTTIPFKVVYGNFVEVFIGWRVVNGFVPTSEVKTITDWIAETNIDSMDGFIKMYNNLSAEVQEELAMMGSPDAEELYNGYVKPLIKFYFAAYKEGNSIASC